MSRQPIDDVTWEVSDLATASTPLVSVVMLTYNHKPYLGEAIEGVVRQRRDFDMELVISDDCSTDGTTQIALDYQRRYPELIRVIGAQHNAGMITNHVRLLRASRGQYVAFCEGDDYWTVPDKLEQQVRCLSEHRDVGAVHTAFDRIAYVRGRWRRFPGQKLGTVREGDLFSVLLGQNVIQTCTVMIRGELIRDYLASGVSIERYAVGDWPLFLYVSARSRIAFLDRVTAAYRKTPGSQINSGARAEMLRARSYINMNEDFCRLFRVPPEHRLASHCALTMYLAWSATRAGDLAVARKAWDRLDQVGYRSQRDDLHRLVARKGLLRSYQATVAAKDILMEYVHYRKSCGIS